MLAGIKRPDSSWSWDQFVQVAMCLTGPDRYGYADRGEWMHWVWQAGGEVISSDRRKALINQPAAVQGLEFAQDLMHRFRVQPLPGALQISALEMFARGQIAMYGSLFGLIHQQGESKFKREELPLPLLYVFTLSSEPATYGSWWSSPFRCAVSG